MELEQTCVRKNVCKLFVTAARNGAAGVAALRSIGKGNRLQNSKSGLPFWFGAR